MRRRLYEIIEKFRQKGVTSPEKALSPDELGLPPQFEQAMHRRLGQTGIFVEVNGKYYLNEERLRQVQQEQNQTGGPNSKRPPTWLRYAGIILMLPIGIIIALLLFLVFSQSDAGYYPGEFFIIFLVVTLLLFVARMLLWRSRGGTGGRTGRCVNYLMHLMRFCPIQQLGL